MAESISIPRILTPETWQPFATQLGDLLNRPAGAMFVWNRGCVTVPTNTTISGAEQIVFPSDFTGNGTLVLTVFDAEGGVNVALNGTELGSLSGTADQEVLYEVAVTNLVEGDNPLNVFKIWSTTSDSAELRKLEVYRNFIREEIDNALADAATAQSTADGKIESFFQDGPPTASGVGDVWFDTDDNNKVYRWSGSDWTLAQDTDVPQAIADASTAQATADGKVTTFFAVSGSPPTAEGIGDLWFQTDTNQTRRWDGTDWDDRVASDAIWGNITIRPKEFSNLVPDPNFENGSIVWIDISDQHAVITDPLGTPVFKNVVEMTGDASATDTSDIIEIPCNVGEVIYLRYWGLKDGSVNSGADFGSSMAFFNEAGSNFNTLSVLADESEVNTTTWTEITGQVTVPAGAVTMRVRLRNQANHTAGKFYLAMPVASRHEQSATLNTGALADKDTADFATDVSGAEKPADNATNNTGALGDLDTVGTPQIDDDAATAAKLGTDVSFRKDITDATLHTFTADAEIQAVVTTAAHALLNHEVGLIWEWEAREVPGAPDGDIRFKPAIWRRIDGGAWVNIYTGGFSAVIPSVFTVFGDADQLTTITIDVPGAGSVEYELRLEMSQQAAPNDEDGEVKNARIKTTSLFFKDT